MKLTSLLQLVDKLQKARKIDNLQRVCGISGCVSFNHRVTVGPFPVSGNRIIWRKPVIFDRALTYTSDL